MQWQGRPGSTNVEDRRSSNMLGWGLGGGGLLLLGLLFWLWSGNPFPFIGLAEEEAKNDFQQSHQYTPSADDTLAQFVAVVLKDTEDVWTSLFEQMGKTYRKPTLVLFSEVTVSSCGIAGSITGPFYCSEDEKIYLDLSFFQEMKNEYNAGGDFAYAYVIAHEVGHHVQKQLGTLEEIDLKMANSTQRKANKLSVGLELQADFYAGIWAHYTQKMFQSLDPGDIDEALNAAAAIGDDRLQKQQQGYVVPDSFTHGTSQQRHDWFYKGYISGDISQGNTF